MPPQLPHTPLSFYCSSSGREPVRDWLKALPIADRRAVGLDLMRVQFRWPVGMPLCRALGDGLWEVRSTLQSKRIARVIFCFVGDVLVALHALIKKTQKMPLEDLRIARDRMKEILQ